MTGDSQSMFFFPRKSKHKQFMMSFVQKITHYHAGFYTVVWDDNSSTQEPTANLDGCPLALTRYWTHKIASAKRTITALKKRVPNYRCQAPKEPETPVSALKEELHMLKSVVKLQEMRIKNMKTELESKSQMPPAASTPSASEPPVKKQRTEKVMGSGKISSIFVRKNATDIVSYDPSTGTYDVRIDNKQVIVHRAILCEEEECGMRIPLLLDRFWRNNQIKSHRLPLNGK